MEGNVGDERELLCLTFSPKYSLLYQSGAILQDPSPLNHVITISGQSVPIGVED